MITVSRITKNTGTYAIYTYRIFIFLYPLDHLCKRWQFEFKKGIYCDWQFSRLTFSVYFFYYYYIIIFLLLLYYYFRAELNI